MAKYCHSGVTKLGGNWDSGVENLDLRMLLTRGENIDKIKYSCSSQLPYKWLLQWFIIRQNCSSRWTTVGSLNKPFDTSNIFTEKASPHLLQVHKKVDAGPFPSLDALYPLSTPPSLVHGWRVWLIYKKKRKAEEVALEKVTSFRRAPGFTF